MFVTQYAIKGIQEGKKQKNDLAVTLPLKLWYGVMLACLIMLLTACASKPVAAKCPEPAKPPAELLKQVPETPLS